MRPPFTAEWPAFPPGTPETAAVVARALKDSAKLPAPSHITLKEGVLDLSWDNNRAGVFIHDDATHTAYVHGDTLWAHRTFPYPAELREFLVAQLQLGAATEGDAFTAILMKRTKADLSTALVRNHMEWIGTKAVLVARAREGMLFGVPLQCKNCHYGFLQRQDDQTTYKCQGIASGVDFEGCGEEVNRRNVGIVHWKGGVPPNTRSSEPPAWPSVPPRASAAATSVVHGLRYGAGLPAPDHVTLTEDEFDGDTSAILSVEWDTLGIHVFVHDDGESDVHLRGDFLHAHREFPPSDHVRLARLLRHLIANAPKDTTFRIGVGGPKKPKLTVARGASLKDLLWECDTQDLKHALRLNDMHQAGTKQDLVKRVADGMQWGVPCACPTCGSALNIGSCHARYDCENPHCDVHLLRDVVPVTDWRGATPRTEAAAAVASSTGGDDDSEMRATDDAPRTDRTLRDLIPEDLRIMYDDCQRQRTSPTGPGQDADSDTDTDTDADAGVVARGLADPVFRVNLIRLQDHLEWLADGGIEALEARQYGSGRSGVCVYRRAPFSMLLEALKVGIECSVVNTPQGALANLLVAGLRDRAFSRPCATTTNCHPIAQACREILTDTAVRSRQTNEGSPQQVDVKLDGREQVISVHELSAPIAVLSVRSLYEISAKMCAYARANTHDAFFLQMTDEAACTEDFLVKVVTLRVVFDVPVYVITAEYDAAYEQRVEQKRAAATDADDASSSSATLDPGLRTVKCRLLDDQLARQLWHLPI